VTTFLLLRHAAHDWLGRGIAGRLQGVDLNPLGRQQAAELARRLAVLPVRRILSSPQQRTRETARPLADALRLEVDLEPAFDEVDFGAWTGRSFEQLQASGEAWEHWVERRATAQPPGGEAFADVPRRAMAALRRWQGQHPDDHVVVVSHGDVIKAVLATCLGMSLDRLERFEIAPASVSVVAMGADWQQVRLVNGPGLAG
jgi:probable phosphoglycerate mutase